MNSKHNPYAVTSVPTIQQCTTIESAVSRSPITALAFDIQQVGHEEVKRCDEVKRRDDVKRDDDYIKISQSQSSSSSSSPSFIIHHTGTTMDRDIRWMDHIHFLSSSISLLFILREIGSSIECRVQRRDRKNVNVLKHWYIVCYSLGIENTF